jgi:hypothetical protein
MAATWQEKYQFYAEAMLLLNFSAKIIGLFKFSSILF